MSSGLLNPTRQDQLGAPASTSGLTYNAASGLWLPTAISGSLADYVPLTQKGAASGVATLDSGGQLPVAQLPIDAMELKGGWNASTNTPTLVDGTGSSGDFYKVTTGATRNLGSGAIVFTVGDAVVYDGSTWFKVDSTDTVASVAGKTGVVTLDGADVANTAAGNIASTTVQTAINELDTEKMAKAHSAFTDLTYTGNWQQTGGGYQNGRYKKLDSGLVILELLAARTVGTSSSPITILTMPVGYRPAAAIQAVGARSGSFVLFDLMANGDLIGYGAWTVGQTACLRLQYYNGE